MRIDKTETLAAFERYRISAIIRTEDASLASRAMQAAVEGGIRIVEFTLTTPEALTLIREFASQPGVVVGAGTVLTVEQARQAVECGARFLVSPICDPQVVAEGNSLGAVTVPGTFTATEMMAAHRCGADLLKLFPIPGIGADYVKACLGPMPFLKIFPTSGVTVGNFLQYLEAGAFGVGFVGSLFTPDDLAAGEVSRIRERAAEIIRCFETSPFSSAP
jgi:2-dehydro-3-deoxyphosphogluconate aldolase/(4S)-4-hydroxy-2-oxoglutarate aldolase